MNIKEYFEESSRTEGSGSFMEMKDVSNNLKCGTEGLATQSTLLLDAENAEDVWIRLGIIMWYVGVVARAEKIDPVKLQNDAAHANINSNWLAGRFGDWAMGALAVMSNRISESIQRVVWNGEQIHKARQSLYPDLVLVVASIIAITIEYDWELGMILDDNITRLKDKHPERFPKDDTISPGFKEEATETKSKE